MQVEVFSSSHRERAPGPRVRSSRIAVGGWIASG